MKRNLAKTKIRRKEAGIAAAHGRNRPPNAKFVDWSSQEAGIAAALSREILIIKRPDDGMGEPGKPQFPGPLGA